jgi:hypothetical protein
MAYYNIVRDYDWTSNPRGSSQRNDAPKIWMLSYDINSNQIMSAAKGFISVATNTQASAKTFYDDMYGKSTTPKDHFWFPYFSDNFRSFGNTFGDTFQSGVGGSGGTLSDMNDQMKQWLGGLADLYNTAMSFVTSQDNPGTYIETPMFYQFEKNDAPVEFSVILSNTLNSDSYLKNSKLIEYLTRINRPLRRNSIAVDPPRIYQIRIHGLRYIRWAYCSNFSVELIGARREIEGVIVPEAYRISMSFQSLTLEHAGFMNYIHT